MRIRLALMYEAAALSRLARRSKAHWGYSAAQLDAWDEALAITKAEIASGMVFVTEEDGDILGFYAATPAGTAWHLSALWVLPEHMRRGIGQAMLRHARHQARAAGVTELRIDADPHAEPFYLACGAVRIGVVPAPLEQQPQRQRPQLLLRFAQGRVLRSAGDQ